MLKRDELSDPASCLNRADDNEIVFVLLGRDVAAPETIRAWIELRIQHGKNNRQDAQIQDAERCVEKMFEFQREPRP